MKRISTFLRDNRRKISPFVGLIVFMFAGWFALKEKFSSDANGNRA
jgi:hypothetical protein